MWLKCQVRHALRAMKGPNSRLNFVFSFMFREFAIAEDQKTSFLASCMGHRIEWCKLAWFHHFWNGKYKNFHLNFYRWDKFVAVLFLTKWKFWIWRSFSTIAIPGDCHVAISVSFAEVDGRRERSLRQHVARQRHHAQRIGLRPNWIFLEDAVSAIPIDSDIFLSGQKIASRSDSFAPMSCCLIHVLFLEK